MPLPRDCRPRYRVVKKGGKRIRLAFCGGKVVETKELPKRPAKRT